MAEPFLGEIRIMSFNFPPKGWAQCNGQFLPINQNQALFALMGTTYGGNGQTNFALPNFRGRTPIHMGNGHTMGEAAGSTAVTINIQQLPQHFHSVNATSAVQNGLVPTGASFASSNPSEVYSGTSNGAMHPQTLSNVGGSQPHNNMQPYLTLNFCVALQGIFPSQN